METKYIDLILLFYNDLSTVVSSAQSFKDLLCLAGTQITISSDPFGEGTGPIHLDVVRCVGDERALIDCPRNDIGVLSSACATDHTEDAGVMCGRLIMILSKL